METNYIVIDDSITYGIGDFESGYWATMLKKYIVKLPRRNQRGSLLLDLLFLMNLINLLVVVLKNLFFFL